MIRKALKSYFCSSKHFLDEQFQNIRIQTTNKVGSLYKISKIFASNDVNLSYIKSQCSNAWTQRKKYELDVSIQRQTPQKLQHMKKLLHQFGATFQAYQPIVVPWFPRKYEDLNLIGRKLLQVKDEVNKDHPQFSDQQYRKRRDYIAKVAIQYQLGDRIPDIPYTEEQTELWKNIYAKLSNLHKKGMSKRFLAQISKIQKQFMISKRIPQLNQLNAYLKNKTGFTIKPTHGILSQRQFLNCFAFRVFCCTQYLRHTKTPDYTPQPDIVHEIIGHVPMFADPDVAELSQQIGLLSLGATDEQIVQLGTLYWFTLQFGACLQGDKKLGYGAGIASSISQISHLMSPNAGFDPFNPVLNCKQSYTIQDVQKNYKVTQSFERALLDLQLYSKTVMKPISTSYNFQKKQVEYDRNIEGVDVGDKPIEFI